VVNRTRLRSCGWAKDRKRLRDADVGLKRRKCLDGIVIRVAAAIVPGRGAVDPLRFAPQRGITE
jgi:hypothetical protein